MEEKKPKRRGRKAKKTTQEPKEKKQPRLTALTVDVLRSTCTHPSSSLSLIMVFAPSYCCPFLIERGRLC